MQREEAVNENPEQVRASEDAPVAQVDPLEELKEIDFLLEDIEDEIAPLALTRSL